MIVDATAYLVAHAAGSHLPMPQVEADAITLEALILGLLDMDEVEATAIEALRPHPNLLFERNPARFLDILLEVIREHRLYALFSRDPEGEQHRCLHPTAYNRRIGEPFPSEMAQWRAHFRAMAPEQQMMAATVIWMYQAGPDSTWLRRVPCTWHAHEALHYLSDAGCLERWLALVARYVPW